MGASDRERFRPVSMGNQSVLKSASPASRCSMGTCPWLACSGSAAGPDWVAQGVLWGRERERLRGQIGSDNGGP